MKRLFFAVILAIMFIALPVLGLSDTAISGEHVDNLNTEIAGRISEASNSLASASITITMTGVLDE